MGLLGAIPGVAGGLEVGVVTGCTSPPTIIGTTGNDVLVGTPGDDVILGLAGDDAIHGRGGNDEICGGPGNDSIEAGNGKDLVFGGAGKDHILGGPESDRIYGGLGNDSLSGDDGNDLIDGGKGRDTIWGGPGRDRLFGREGNDVIRGNGGRDRIHGGIGNDLILGTGNNDVLRGGSGADVVKGWLGDDLLVGGPDGDLLIGGPGNDTLLGHAGSETIRGRAGDDFLDGGAGLELLAGGLGTDTCADEGIERPCSNPGDLPYGGHVIVADDQEPPTLNPLVPGGDNFVVSIIGQSYFGGVANVDAHTLERVPHLVTQLPTVANGGVVVNQDGTMTVSYDIDTDAVWSDGVPISGQDFQFTLDTILDPALPTNKTYYEDVVSSVAEPKAFAYTMASATVNHEQMFEVILPKHAVEGTDFTNGWNDRMWPSAGSFVFVEWVLGEHVKVERNERYWKSDPATGQQLPYLDGVTFTFIPETLAQIRAFERRQVDVIQPPPDLTRIDRLKATEGAGGIVEVIGGPVWEHLNFQFGPGRLDRNRSSANDNLNYRKGVMHTIDRQLLVDEILGGFGDGPMSSHVDAMTKTWSNGAWDQYDYNPATAMAYFDQAKADLVVDELSAIFSTTSNNDARVQMSELLVSMFADVGVAYENQLEDSHIFFGDTLENGSWDIGEWAWVGSPGLTGLEFSFDIFDPEQPAPQGSNYYRWGSPDSSVIDAATMRFAELHDAAAATVDQAQLVAYLDEAQTILADNAVFLPLYQRLTSLAHWGDEVGNVKHNSSSDGHTWNIEEWFRADR